MIYFDHSATTKPFQAVIDCLAEGLSTNFYNPVALYRPAIAADQIKKEALKKFAHHLGCKAEQLIVTSGGTESTSTVFHSICRRALKQVDRANQINRPRIIISAGEHAATHEHALWASGLGFDVQYCALLPNGKIDLKHLATLLTPETQLISCLSVQNETGAYNDPNQIVALKDQYCPKAWVHIDHVQAWNKVPIRLNASGIDFASFSGHKIHAVKGMGLLYVKQPSSFHPMILGGGQQYGLRSGTEHPVGVQAMAIASEIGYQGFNTRVEKVQQLRKHALNLLSEYIGEDQYHVHAAESAIPHILSVSFKKARGETLLHILEQKDILVSTGSACSSHKKKYGGRVFQAMAVDPVWLEGIIRISLDPDNTMDEVLQLALALKEALQTIYKLR